VADTRASDEEGVWRGNQAQRGGVDVGERGQHRTTAWRPHTLVLTGEGDRGGVWDEGKECGDSHRAVGVTYVRGRDTFNGALWMTTLVLPVCGQ